MLHRFYKEGEQLDVAGLNLITVLIDRSETEITEVALNEWRAGLELQPDGRGGSRQSPGQKLRKLVGGPRGGTRSRRRNDPRAPG